MPRHDRGPIAIDVPVQAAAYADGDLLCQAMEIPDVCLEGQPCYVNSLTVIDYDDQGVALDFLIFDRDPGDLGDLNDAAALSDTQAGYIQAAIPVSSGDYVDIGAQQVGQPEFYARKVRPHHGGTSLWIAAVANGAPTYASGKLRLWVGVVRLE